MIDQKTRTNLVRLAQRYPSPHNVQPAAWSLTPEGQVHLFSREARRLFVGDPGRRDHLVSLGAAWECMHVAASKLGYRLSGDTANSGPTDIRGNETWVIRTATLIPSEGLKDPLCSHIETRRSFRGVFKDKLSAEKLAELSASGWTLVQQQKDLDCCAALHDQATMSFMKDRSFAAELYQWLRLSDNHPSYNEDGLNREAMSLGKAEGWIANWLLKPGIFSVLAKMGLGSIVVTEAPQIKSSSAIAILTAEANEDPFESGRKLMRSWLKMAELGVSGCPISSTTDHENSRKKLLALAGLPATTSVILALRVGPTPKVPYLSPRLSYENAVTKV